MTNRQVITVLAVAAGWAMDQIVAASAPVAGESVPVMEKADQNLWRVSAGLDYRFRFKTDLRMNTGRYNAAHPPFTPPQNGGLSFDEVSAQVGNGTAADGRRVYADGYVDHSSLSGGFTFNWAANNISQYQEVDPAHGGAATVTFSSNPYVVTEANIGARTANPISDDTDMAGVSLDVDRELWRKGDFSLGVSLGGSYFPKRTLISTSQSFAAGTYNSTEYTITDVYNVNSWAGDPPTIISGGGFGGPINDLPYVPEWRLTQSRVLSDETFGGGAWVDADMWMAEGRLCLTPEWRVLDRFSLLGNLGVAVEYAGISSHSGSWMTENQEKDVHNTSNSQDELIVQAILGLGARYMVTEHVGLSLTGEARLPRTKIDIEADPYEGHVDLGIWSVGTQLDYAF